MAASKESLGRLHTAIADKLTDALNEMTTDTKGLASILNVARQFVKDNGIEALPTEGNSVGRLNKKLEEFPFDPTEDPSGRSH